MLPLLTDLRHALRGLRKTPGFAAIAISSLALGIGVNVTVYSVAREMILDDLSARRPDRLVRLGGVTTVAAYGELRRAGIFQDVAYDTGLGNVDWDTGDHKEIAWEMTTSANFFDVLGVRASAGRLFSQADEGRAMAVVSHGFWRVRLHGNPNAVGRALLLGDRL